nr:hypothetical protein [uncultured Flavobacterium sp.]
MKAIGGYFELELNKKGEYHQDAIRLNTGRNAFEYILLANSYTKVYLPFFTCDVLLEPLKKHQITFEFYNIDEQFEPLFNYNIVQSREIFLYINYFGLKDNFIKTLANQFNKLIIDNSQSFYAKPIKGIDTFYSPRKFFGIPDGAYLYCNNKLEQSFEKDLSFDRCSHLLKRMDSIAESGYEDFTVNDASLRNQDIKEMSSLTQSLLSAIDYDVSADKRVRNFNFLHQKLKARNKLRINLLNNGVPMVYPYWSGNKNLRQKLLDNRVYTAIYWNNVKQWCKSESIEYRFVDEIVYLPMDQRYNETDLNKIIKILEDEY